MAVLTHQRFVSTVSPILEGDVERGQAGEAGRGQILAKAIACCTSELVQDGWG